MTKNKPPIIIVSGGLDPIHSGHVAMIQDAANYGKVVVILNSDNWLRRKKGYIFMNLQERSDITFFIKNVFLVTDCDDSDNTVCDGIRKIANMFPDRKIYFANGGDRKSDNVPEVQVCGELGIEMLWNIGGGKTQSSSDLVKNAWMQCLNNQNF